MTRFTLNFLFSHIPPQALTDTVVALITKYTEGKEEEETLLGQKKKIVVD